MNPKSYKEVIKEVAEEMGLDQSIVEDAVSVYWSKLRSKLVNMEWHRIFVPCLGTFEIKEWKADIFIKKYRFLKKYKTKEQIDAFVYKSELDLQYRKLLKVKAMFDQDRELKAAHKKKRADYEANKHLEQQKEDT